VPNWRDNDAVTVRRYPWTATWHFTPEFLRDGLALEAIYHVEDETVFVNTLHVKPSNTDGIVTIEARGTLWVSTPTVTRRDKIRHYLTRLRYIGQERRFLGRWHVEVSITPTVWTFFPVRDDTYDGQASVEWLCLCVTWWTT
jgi:hypothetical protein